MAITTLDSMISGLQNPIDFVRGLTGTMIAGRPVDLSVVPYATQAWYKAHVIYRVYANAPSDGYTTIYTNGVSGLPFSVGQEISVSGYGTADICGVHTVYSVVADTIVVSTDTASDQSNNGIICCRDAQSSAGCGGTNGSLSSMSSYPAKLPFTNPASGNTYLARLEAQAGVAGTLLLCDRLWFTAGITSFLTPHTEYFANLAQIPARDMNGTNNGHGVLAAIVVLGSPYYAGGATAGTATLTYTNQSGTTGKTSSLLIPDTGGANLTGYFFPMDLAFGDTGIRQVESLTISDQFIDMYDFATESGSLGLVLYRVLARLPLKRMHTRQAIDALTAGFPRLFDDTNPFLVFIPAATTSSYVAGALQYAQG